MAYNMYKNGKIYKLVNDVDDKIYVGSSCNILSTRFGWHKKAAKLNPDRRVYNHLNEIGWESVKIILVEEYPCDSKKHLEARERYWIETLKPELNKKVPTRTKNEYYNDNKNQILDHNQEYYNKNKFKISEQHLIYRSNNNEKYQCGCGSHTTKLNRTHHEKTIKHQQWLSNQNL